METSSFREILESKLKGKTGAYDSPEISANPFPERISELHPALYFLSVQGPKPNSLKGYPKTSSSPRKTQVPQGEKLFTPREKTAEKIEFQVAKDRLDEISLSKWNRFESMVGQNFGATLTKSQALSAFRTFIKTVHPDLSGGVSTGVTGDFASFVKVKNEMIQVLVQFENSKS